MNMTPSQRERAARADAEKPWDGWELWMFDSHTGEFICIARNRVELLERTPRPVQGTSWRLDWKRVDARSEEA
jgi:hypothetical protein